MPLPLALANKLSKRGILTNCTKVNEKDAHSDHKSAVGCPNKSNIYHECTNWCQVHWKGFIVPEARYTRNVRKLLEKYPLPKNWTEIFDKGIGRYYFWNIETDLVSWLPPQHPKAVLSECATVLRMKLHVSKHLHKDQIEKDSDKKREHKHHRDKRDNRDDDRKYRHEDGERGKKRRRNEDLDPMDPSAYSDVPRGTWSDGLENNKLKADSTAAGALFQQRPYPAPGEVLNANKQKSKKK